ncbi:TIGR00730 family Rossman fold protein [Lampropedia puyangensis]|uniref:Cytokinin riboside 5'-monophosphate phosphoribohydrolase n=1 Tax=Lampropedia puyangensis TaxID=1330072 RepID=A0A4S8F7B6_9BURK|nr:TIGR00730 family Rossman fold protein [Lampropedia puyangensis]THU02781.1 TIGR00730 family Rossman fold protein [Lampropedia puyangensis]
MTSPHFSICVYCGSRDGTSALMNQAAEQVGHWIGEHGGQLVYGGGKTGLMGTVARATKQAGGRVIGIIPTALVHKELANDACDELHVVETMHQRKAMMAERSNAFLTLPGGIGTFEELFEIWTWRQLGYHDKPIGILNAAGYYDGLESFLSNCSSNGFMNDWQMQLVEIGQDVPTLLQGLVQAAGMPQHNAAELTQHI